MTKRKAKSLSTVEDVPAQAKPVKEKGTLDLVRIMVIANPNVTAAEVREQLPEGKVISDSSLASVLYEVRKNLSLLRELGMLKD